MKSHKKKMVQIEDSMKQYQGTNYHPLYAGNYFGGRWVLKPFVYSSKQKGADCKHENHNKRGRNTTATENGFDRFKDMLKDDGKGTDFE